MSRQERVRRERFARASEEVQDCTHLDLYVTAQAEAKQHSAIAAEDRAKLEKWNKSLHHSAIEGGANGELELRERWLADRPQAEFSREEEKSAGFHRDRSVSKDARPISYIDLYADFDK